ncbi:hypothetical protein [Carnobacterium maltaromaticum]|uniref:hypothetical protein n=1 Tax=Carnobacterium maltaromaticum TaxID=2751 RepID=UPI001DA55131|nr:hypothetical protein [Carnobacterium maltaromaticum]MCC4312327.1 hypothetical protein [Carnobacterium maltaromaticum]
MVILRSFTKYVKVKFYNELFDAVDDYISNHGDEDLELNSESVYNFEEVVLEDIDVKKVYVSNSLTLDIDFDVLVEAEICVI